MSHRTTTQVNFKTGRVVTTQTTTAATSFGERITGLVASASEHVGEPSATVGTIFCDGCQRVEPIDLSAPTLPEGWVDTDHGDFCPSCQD